MKKFSWRGLVIIAFMLVTVFFLAPLMIKNLPAWWASRKLNLGLDLKGGMQILLEVDTSELTAGEIDGAVKNNIEIIRNRIDQFGVAEPSIQKLGEKRIMVQLPGVKDHLAAENLVQKTAMLEFKLVAPNEEAERVVAQIDQNISMNLQSFPKLAELDRKDRALADSLKVASDTLGTKDGIFKSFISRGEVDYLVQVENVRLMQSLIADSLFARVVPMGYQVSLGKADLEAVKADRSLYILKSAVEMSGTDISRARVDFGSATSTDPRTANKPYVSLEMKREGARKFERVTNDNVGKRLAIVLDDVVYSAPNIQERIAGGRAQITGRFTTSEANELAILLNSKNLDAPIRPISTTIIGATLGTDSIRSGTKAGIIGLIAVILFMIVYYKVAGLIADFVLVFNIGFILSVLTMFGATLTLPGIAGIILTIGMAVDANVLVFERIREELDAGKTPRSAVDAGYKRAIITIWDANITTLIAAAVLYNFGSGPIRGFAITLAIGIIGSMFCALIFVRTILDNFVLVGNKKNLSI
ncbi:MAG: protein translocase subunit SecD [Candidatus Cloacimonadaceae bacterium]|nr:protein translocase subunit SecD [Candidatus Cloacimonadaceae bacterium]MDP3113901.1 protein translocase subunit SecD [Candidatus Cloacimonadaceae bacterium]